MNRRKVLLVGWDAADWKVARPLMEQGLMPNLSKLVDGGASGNLATIYPPLSPMLWTSIATGKRPHKHGIHGFTEPLPDGSGIRPITSLGRTTKAVWNIFNQNEIRPSVVGWWPSHPAEPIDGVMVSNHFHQAGVEEEPRPMLPGSVHPADWSERLDELRVVPMELPGEVIRLFVPEYDQVDQGEDKRVHELGKMLAETLTLHAAATEVLEHAEWDFAAVYYDAIDHFSHGFMGFHPPRLPWVDEKDFAIYQHVITAIYCYHDAMLGRLIELAGPDATVIVMSDHGFHPDALRPGYIPAEMAGPAVEHRHFGMLAIQGPGIKPGETIYGASVLDIAPTLLHLYGLAVGQDMDGKVLVTAFEKPGTVETVATWDAIEGNAGTHPPDLQLDPVASAEAMKQLVALGYVAPPGDDVARSVRETVAELRYNLARALDDADQPAESKALYETLHADAPDDHRYLEKLINALLVTGDRARARTLLDAFDARCAETGPAAEAELARRRTVKADEALETRCNPLDERDQFERRVLREQASEYALIRKYLRLQLDLADERFDEVRDGLSALEPIFKSQDNAPALFLAKLHARLGDDVAALSWIDRALERDPDDWNALALAARVHFQKRRIARAIDAAAASLALIYFQPITHYVLGRSLMARGERLGAERSFLTALWQAPGLVPAHEALARLYDKQPGRSSDATLHRNRAVELRRQWLERRGRQPARVLDAPRRPVASLPERQGSLAAETDLEIVVVAGLPRSGTSMVMQMLEAGGVEPLTDGLRQADADNPRGYLEYEPATRIGQGDRSWMTQARGKALKLALPLVTSLPTGETYRLIVIERDPLEVIASQKAMLARLGRTADGGRLDDNALAFEYHRQRERLRVWLEARPEVAVLPLRYDAVLADPVATARRISEFLARPFDRESAGLAVAPGLRRQVVGAGI